MIPRNDFIERRLASLTPYGAVLSVKLPGELPVRVCSIVYLREVFTRVWNDHATVHFDGDLDIRVAAERFLEGQG